MEPLIVTATPNICWLNPSVPYPRDAEAMIEELKQCEHAGASVAHVHAEGRWGEIVEGLREETNLIVQCGMSSLPIPDRMPVFECGADMISIILSHHDEAFAELDTHALHPREELEEYARLSASYRVELEMEIWHTGSIWNMRYLIDRGLLTTPHVTTLFFGWPGGSWTPPTVDEYLRRRTALPESSVATVSAMGGEQRELLVAAIAHGDHIRVGTEDHPFDRNGNIAATHRLVAEAVELAAAYGRPLADPANARRILGLATSSDARASLPTA